MTTPAIRVPDKVLSWNVLLLIEAAFMPSLKVTVILAPTDTPVAFGWIDVLLTVGGVLSGGSVVVNTTSTQ